MQQLQDMFPIWNTLLLWKAVIADIQLAFKVSTSWVTTFR
jgi:hypothetical protein